MSPQPASCTRAFRELSAMMHDYGNVAAKSEKDGTITLDVFGKGHKFTFNVCSSYPFRAPKKVLVDDKIYSSTLRLGERFKSHLLKKFGNSCLCCSSINCGDRWAPCSSMSMFIIEYYFNADIKQKCMECYFADLLCRRSGCLFANVDEYLTGKHDPML